MSILGRKVSLKVVAALVTFLVFAALLPVMSEPRAREVTLVARDMAFYLEGDTRTPNPTIEVKAGERIRVVLRNEDRGMTHENGAVPDSVRGFLAALSEALDLPTPDVGTADRQAYACQLEDRAMFVRGAIEDVLAGNAAVGGANDVRPR